MALTQDGWTFFTVVFGICFLLFAWIVPSHFEAKAFNRVTGKNVSTFDAMFLDLRVNESPR